jgi:hypothetical protein
MSEAQEPGRMACLSWSVGMGFTEEDAEHVWKAAQTETSRLAWAAVEAAIRRDERERLRPRHWTRAMSDAWHRAIPDTIKAFDDLFIAREKPNES